MRNWILALQIGPELPATARARSISRGAHTTAWTNPVSTVDLNVTHLPLISLVRSLAFCLALLILTSAPVLGQSGYEAEGGEYAIAGALLGDQITPEAGLGTNGGYVVWADNITDESGLGISARRVDSSLSGSLSTFRVNAGGTGDQENPRVALLNNGGAVFVWQGGPQGVQQIYARFLSPSNTWLTGDVLVNTYTNSQHQSPAVVVNKNGLVLVVYASYDQDGSFQGIYGQRMVAAGTKLAGEFAVNTTTALNQRSPSAVALSDGTFEVVWVSETALTAEQYDVSIYARRFPASVSTPLSGEIKVSTGTNICANPVVAATSDGRFAVTWAERDLTVEDNGWDIYGRVFSNDGTPVSTVRRLNTMQYGDQMVPKLAALGTDYLAVWASMGQDSSWEGVYGQFMGSDGTLRGGEFQANTTVMSRQWQPAVAADGSYHFLVLWGSFVGGDSSFDLYAQRYVMTLTPLSAPSAPVITVLSSNALSVTWPAVEGLNVVGYDVYADGASVATATTTNNWWVHTNLAPASTHYYQMDYVVADGRHSPLSPMSTNKTYSILAYGGIPYEWMIEYFGVDLFGWPSPYVDSDNDGVSNLNEFLAGTDPTNADSVLRTWLQSSSQGMFLYWNTRPGLVYQPQQSINWGGWLNLGGPRFAAGTNDSLYISGDNSGAFYRILRLR